MTDWQKGDLALCVKVGPWLFKADKGGLEPSTGPNAGAVLTVSAVNFGPNGPCLVFENFPEPKRGSRGYRASRFRKVTPPKADEFDREVIDLMNRKPVEA